MKNPISTILFAILVFQVAALPASEDYLIQDTVIPEVTVGLAGAPDEVLASQDAVDYAAMVKKLRDQLQTANSNNAALSKKVENLKQQHAAVTAKLSRFAGAGIPEKLSKALKFTVGDAVKIDAVEDSATLATDKIAYAKAVTDKASAHAALYRMVALVKSAMKKENADEAALKQLEADQKGAAKNEATTVKQLQTKIEEETSKAARFAKTAKVALALQARHEARAASAKAELQVIRAEMTTMIDEQDNEKKQAVSKVAADEDREKKVAKDKDAAEKVVAHKDKVSDQFAKRIDTDTAVAAKALKKAIGNAAGEEVDDSGSGKGKGKKPEAKAKGEKLEAKGEKLEAKAKGEKPKAKGEKLEAKAKGEKLEAKAKGEKPEAKAKGEKLEAKAKGEKPEAKAKEAGEGKGTGKGKKKETSNAILKLELDISPEEFAAKQAGIEASMATKIGLPAEDVTVSIDSVSSENEVLLQTSWRRKTFLRFVCKVPATLNFASVANVVKDLVTGGATLDGIKVPEQPVPEVVTPAPTSAPTPAPTVKETFAPSPAPTSAPTVKVTSSPMVKEEASEKKPETKEAEADFAKETEEAKKAIAKNDAATKKEEKDEAESSKVVNGKVKKSVAKVEKSVEEVNEAIRMASKIGMCQKKATNPICQTINVEFCTAEEQNKRDGDKATAEDKRVADEAAAEAKKSQNKTPAEKAKTEADFAVKKKEAEKAIAENDAATKKEEKAIAESSKLVKAKVVTSVAKVEKSVGAINAALLHTASRMNRYHNNVTLLQEAPSLDNCDTCKAQLKPCVEEEMKKPVVAVHPTPSHPTSDSDKPQAENDIKKSDSVAAVGADQALAQRNWIMS